MIKEKFGEKTRENKNKFDGEGELAASAGDERRKLEQTIYELSLLRAQANDLQKQLVSMQALIEENAATTQALDALKGVEGEMLFSLGAGVYAKAKAVEKKRIFIEVGARTMVEKSVEEAKTLLGERRVQLEKLVADIQSTLNTAGKRIDELSEKASELTRVIKGKEGMQEI